MRTILRLAAAVALLCAPLPASAQTPYGTSDLNRNQAVLDVPAKGPNGQTVAKVPLFGSIDPYTGAPAGYYTRQLASNAAITSGACTTPITNVAGGSYLIALTATAFNSSTIALQTLGPDGVTYLAVTGATWTANNTLGVVVGNNATLRLCATGGSPTGVYALLS